MFNRLARAGLIAGVAAAAITTVVAALADRAGVSLEVPRGGDSIPHRHPPDRCSDRHPRHRQEDRALSESPLFTLKAPALPSTPKGIPAIKLTLTTFMSIDGVMQSPGGPAEDASNGFALGGWLVPFADMDMGTYVADWFSHADAFRRAAQGPTR